MLLGCIVVCVGNLVLWVLVRLCSEASWMHKHGTPLFANTVGLAVLSLLAYMTLMLFGSVYGRIVDPGDRLILLACGVITGLPWIGTVGALLMESSAGGMIDSLYALNQDAIDKADMRKAHALLQDGKRVEAIAELRRVRGAFPESPSPLSLLAVLAKEDGDFDRAEVYFRLLMDEQQQDRVIWTNAARQLTALLRHDLNDPHAAQEVELEIKQATLRYETPHLLTSKKTGKMDWVDLDRARRLVTRGQVPEAIAAMKRYIAQHPKKPKPYFELVSLFERVERVDDSVIWLQKIIREFADDDQVWATNRGAF